MFSAPALSRRLPASALPLCAVAAFCLAALLTPSSSQAQTPGQLDTSFNSATTGATYFALTLQHPGADDDVITVGGDFDALNRLNADGSASGVADSSGNPRGNFVLPDFGNPGRIIYTIVQEKVLNSDAEPNLLVGGLFGRTTAQLLAKLPGQNIIRLLPDSEIDTTFNPGKGADNEVTAILPRADGSMVVGGLFDLFNGLSHNHIVCLDHSGAIVDNSTFSSGLNIDDTVLSLADQLNPNAAGPQGQILVAGTFTHVNGDAHSSLARLNADGSLDTSFNPVFNARVRIVVSQPDGKILAGGDFDNVNGTGVKHLVRLNYDGSLDTTFNARVTTQPPLIAEPVAVNTITPAANGSFYIGGNFAQVNGIARRYLARVLADGTVDSFDPGLIITNTVQQVALDPVINRVYVTETRSKSVGNSNTDFPASVIRLYGASPTVSVAAKQSVVPGTALQKVKFTLTRSGADLGQATTVYFSLSGNGVSRLGVDFQLKKAQASGNLYAVTIPVDEDSVNVKLVPIENGVPAGPDTFIFTVQPDPSNSLNYTTDASASQTVTLTK